MKKILLLFLLSGFYLQGQFRCQDLKQDALTSISSASINNNGKSDTVDILHYSLALDLTDIANRNLAGSCSIDFAPKLNNVNHLNLDLLQLTADSILMNGASLTYTHQGEILNVDLGNNYSIGDTLQMIVYYGGSPKMDNSGWGGFHTSGGYYFNLGVGFAADPHTYGRAWFPCFDNFVEKSTYDFTIETLANHRAYCNGLETSNVIASNGNRFTSWNMTDPIPTYLASVAVSNYVETNYTLNTASGILPIQLVSRQAQQNSLQNAFTNLDSNLVGFIKHFGDYRWQRVGYVLTTQGAMEHATSIHFPVSLINQGQNAAEDIMAHELAHHWWGNLITCETADDMWINEGMAEFCSHLFFEDVYDRERYLNVVFQNAYNVINNAHVQDGGYRSIYALPHQYVYGFHVYQKGAMVAHNLRAYLGDNLFFNGLTTLLDNNEFGNLSTQEFRDQLSQITGKNLNNFFDGWVYNEGFPSVAVQNFQSSAANSATIKVVQRQHKAPALYANIPVEVTFFSQTGDTANRTVILQGDTATATFAQLPFTPSFALASYSGKLLTADTYDEIKLTQKKIYADRYGKMRLTLEQNIDSATAIVTHHYAGPGGKIPAGKDYLLSQSRYWTVRGIDLSKANITALVKYDGTANGYDADLVNNSEDSIVVLYRAKPQDPWALYPNQVKSGATGPVNKIGTIELSNLLEGDYVFANTAEKVSVEELRMEKGSIDMYPNPADDKIKIRFLDKFGEHYDINITDVSGKLIHSQSYDVTKQNVELSIPLAAASGFVIVQINGEMTKVVIDGR